MCANINHICMYIFMYPHSKKQVQGFKYLFTNMIYSVKDQKKKSFEF